MDMGFYIRRGTSVKVFISWSGERSKKIAKALKKWIKNVIQSVEPFVSSEDIAFPLSIVVIAAMHKPPQ